MKKFNYEKLTFLIIEIILVLILTTIYKTNIRINKKINDLENRIQYIDTMNSLCEYDLNQLYEMEER